MKRIHLLPIRPLCKLHNALLAPLAIVCKSTVTLNAKTVSLALRKQDFPLIITFQASI